MIRTPLLNDLMGLRTPVDDHFGETFGTRDQGGGVTVRPMPLDVYATDDEVVVAAAVPGMSPEDLDLTVHQNTVTLSGSLRSVVDSEEAKGSTWYINELPSGSFRRSITLPFQVDADNADATFEHGILRVVLPKAEAAKPKRLAIGGRQQQAIGAQSTDQS